MDRDLIIIYAALFWAAICAIVADNTKKMNKVLAFILGVFLRSIGLIIVAIICTKKDKGNSDINVQGQSEEEGNMVYDPKQNNSKTNDSLARDKKYEQVKILKEYLDNGTLTQEEYDKGKRAILNMSINIDMKQLERAKELLDIGAITQEEYNKEKQLLLGSADVIRIRCRYCKEIVEYPIKEQYDKHICPNCHNLI